MEDFADESVRNITCMCSAQSAKTLTVLVLLAWAIAEDPGPILWVTKNEDEAKKIAKSRLMPLLERCAPVARKLPQSRQAKMTCEIYFPGAPLVIASAENKAALQSTPFRYLLLDEARSYPPGALEMVSKRTRSYAYNYKKVIISTPDEEGDAMHQSYLDGNQCVYHVKCQNPDCGHEQPLEWRDKDDIGGMRWDVNEDTKVEGQYVFDKLLDTVRWECEKCGAKVHDVQKERKALSNSGRWIAQNEKAPSDTKSYHWGALLPWWPSWKEQVREFLKAVRAMQWANHEPLKSFVNETKGLPWTDRMRYAKEEKFIYSRQQDYSSAEHWDQEVRRFMTIDVQGKGGRHFYYVIRSWGKSAASRLMSCGKCFTIEELKEIARENGVNPDNMIFDSGHFTTEVYRYIIESGYRFKAFKGEDREYFRRKDGKKIWDQTDVDPAIGTVGQGKVKRIPLFLYSKEACLDRLAMLQNGQMGDWAFPKDVPDYYALQVTANDRRERVDKNGVTRMEWYKKRSDDHIASCELMQVGAAAMMNLLYEPENEKMPDQESS